MNTKSIFLSKTFWVQFAALAAMAVPAVREFTAANPGAVVTILGAVNVAVRLVTRDRVSLSWGSDYPAGMDRMQAWLAWIWLGAAAGVLGCSLPSCSNQPTPPPISGTVLTDYGTAHYDAKGGLELTLDQRSGK